MKKTFILAIIMLFVLSYGCYASGTTYSVRQVGENTINIVLNAKLPEGQGIEITSVSKREGKLLNIFFKTGKGITGLNSIDVDLRTMLPPVRIILTNIDNPEQGVFKDIKGTAAEEYIRHLHDMGAIEGYTDGTFKPNKSVTRAEFITMLLNSLKVEKKSKSKGFKDTKKHWARDAINTACDMKIVSGFVDGTFKPDKTVTIAEAAKIITRVFVFSTANQKEMPAINKKHWAYDSLRKIFLAGIINKTDSLFKGFKEDLVLNRANCAMIISRAITTN
ncbi:MAG: S-layer homology domain-containing protein [Deltaproteobacteria bacterium]